MRKAVLTFINCLFIFSVYSQEKPTLPACVVINGALNLSGMETDDSFYSSNSNAGFSGGAYIRSDGDFFLTGGLHYASINPTISSKTEYATGIVSMQYFQIPVSVGLQIVKSPDALQCMNVHLGGSFSTLMSVSENNLGITKGDIKNNGFNFVGGIGADLWMFVVGVDYNLLLNHLYDYAGYDNKTRLICWEFSIGMKINLGKIDHE